MDTLKSVIYIVKDLGLRVCKYVNYQIHHHDYVNEFIEMGRKLHHTRMEVEENLKTQVMQPGKIVKMEVEDWLQAARKETAEMEVDDLICKGGCFTYICSSRRLDTKTRALNRDGGIFKQGKKYTNAGEILVIDDHSIQYCAAVLEDNRKRLKYQTLDIEAKLKTQLTQPGKIARREVEDWLEKAFQQIVIEVEDLISQGECSSSSNLKEKTEELKQILKQGEKYTDVCESLVIDDHSIKGVPLPVEQSSGRDYIQEQILEWLKGDEVTRIAVWGMGGVGKTTIVKQVHNQLLKEPKFNKVLWIKVSKDFDIIVEQKTQFDILKFQKMIARRLELMLDHENETILAELISRKLGKGSNVLILDDVCQPFSLADVGIPYLDRNNDCKLLLTTRLQDVARVMDCKVITVNPLPKNEALALFLEKVGNTIFSDGKIKRDVEPFLKQILQKCNGVPLAIVIVAKAMRGKLNPYSWKWALSKLSEFEGIVDTLKFNYECLEPQCQECFLYCTLYPEYYEIPMELIECWIEEGLIYNEGQTRDAMNCEGYAILEKLVDNCLLESVKSRYGRDCVIMQNLLRDMALGISPQFLVKAGLGLEKLPEEHEWTDDLLKVSLMRNYITGFPSSMPSMKCLKLTTLLLSDNKISTIQEAFFEQMPMLKILDLSNNPELGRLPSSVSKLEKLTTLLLRGCSSLIELPSLSNLGGLKKLDLSGTSIEELPQGLSMLTNLKYLGLGGRLSEIPDGLLQNFSKLQHLVVHWNIPLKVEEIGRLRKLEFLYGRFSRVHDMTVLFNCEVEFLIMYDLIVGSYNEDHAAFLADVKLKSIVCCDIDICGESNWLPFDVQKLDIYSCKDVRCLNDISGFQYATDLRFVQINDCDGVEFILSWPWLNPLQELEALNLFELDNLNAVFGKGAETKSAPQPAGSFFSLKEINVCRCNKIKKLFQVRWLGYLLNLQTIEVRWCEQMEEIIWFEYEGGEKAIEKVTLPKLQKMELKGLPTLKSIFGCSGAILICDSIKKITIGECKNIESVFWSGFNPLSTLEYLELWQLENLKSVFDDKALGLSPYLPPTIFFSLKRISISQCYQLKKVFSSGWLLGYFQFLETIEVRGCLQMEDLISSTEYEVNVSLPKLQRLGLMNLPAFKSIYSSSNTVLICDSIESLQIVGCEKLKSIPLSFWSLDNVQLSCPPSLKEIVVDNKECWESLEWDYPNAKDVLLPFCKFWFDSDDIEEKEEEEPLRLA